MRNVVIFTTRKDNLKHFRDHLPRCFQDQERGIREYIYICDIYAKYTNIFKNYFNSPFGVRPSAIHSEPIWA